MHLGGSHLKEVSFPVGGIGAGNIGIDGSGHLRDWEIFNRAGKYIGNGPSHFAVRAERAGKILSAKILNGPLMENRSGSIGENKLNGYVGFGWGPSRETLCGFPHFKSCELDGAFPVANYDFFDSEFPGKVTLTAWSPFIPGESDISSLPCAIFELSILNDTDAAIDYQCIGVLSNPWRGEKASNKVETCNGVTRLILKNDEPKDSFDYGELALSTDSCGCSWQEYLFRGVWSDLLEVYAHDLMQAGPFKNREYSTPSTSRDSGLLAVPLTLMPGERRTARFIISWYIPNRRNDWDDQEKLETLLKESGNIENRWKNYYATLCQSAAQASELIFNDYERIRKDVFLFSDTLHNSTLPESALNGAAENLAVLISPTCLRLEDGTFWGWEGVGRESGSCMGSCQHVWNYAQALSLLFPDLERTLRESQFRFNFDENGGLRFRLMLPLGVKTTFLWPCVDGTFGEIMKTYREWKVSGDTDWLKGLYPMLKRAMEYTWSPKNPHKWDSEKTGLLTGRQHHTLDMELFGPSGWLQSHYLGALKALTEIADICGDNAFSEQCSKIYKNGRLLTEQNLFNGEYYIQKIDLDDKETMTPFFSSDECRALERYWDAEHGEIKYQIGEGCVIDSHLGQWYASLYGIGEILDPEQIHTNLKSIFHYNFKESMAEFINTWRIFSLEEEGGTLICSWPSGKRRPVIPIPYNTETMTGFEWAFAAHCVMVGETEIGEKVANAIRARYSGDNRNPWNEIECGSNYARSMAAFAMLQAYSGFHYDMTVGMIGFAPKVAGDFRCFWSLGTVWGEYERQESTQTIRILHGKANFRRFEVEASAVSLNGEPLQNAVSHSGGINCNVNVKSGDVLIFR